jgi:hypothetical protein
MGAMKEKFIDQVNAGPDDTDWKTENQLEPPPNQVDLKNGKSMWIIDGYKIWARSYMEALQLLPLIQSF